MLDKLLEEEQPEGMEATSIRIFVNGSATEMPQEGSVAELLRFLNVASERVAVELNKGIVRKRDWETTAVGAGAQVEIVEFVGGG